jgi:hypothetical protein
MAGSVEGDNVDQGSDNYNKEKAQEQIHTMAWWIASKRSSRTKGTCIGNGKRKELT